MSYGKTRQFSRYRSPNPGGQEVAGSSPVAPIDVSYAEIDTYDYLHACSAAVTLIKKAVVLPVFRKENVRERTKNCIIEAKAST